MATIVHVYILCGNCSSLSHVYSTVPPAPAVVYLQTQASTVDSGKDSILSQAVSGELVSLQTATYEECACEVSCL